MKYKVLFFDSWKGGIRHYLRLSEALKESNIEPIMVHLGSWGNEEIYSKEEIINGLCVRDISYYTKINFNNILEIEKPNLVLFLSTLTFAHRAMIRFCNYNNIPTINLYHGFVRVQSVDNNKSPYKINRWSYATFALKRLPKMLRYTIPCYIKALVYTKSSLIEWYYFFKNVLEVSTNLSPKGATSDSKTTRCLVYADADKLHAKHRYNFREDEIFSVGNPDLLSFNMNQNLIGYGLNEDLNRNKNIIYIDTALTATGLIFKNQTEYIKHIIDTKEAISKQGFTLSLKPHPETRRLYNLQIFRDNNLEIIENDDFVEKLKTCRSVIVEPSTLALIPALMGIPLILPKYGELSVLSFGEVLLSYPRAIVLHNIQDLTSLLNDDECSKNIQACNDWFVTNAGPLPSEDMPYRVVNNIIELIK